MLPRLRKQMTMRKGSTGKGDTVNDNHGAVKGFDYC